MTTDTAQLIERQTYLNREVAIWRARKERALRSDNQGLKDLYLSDELDSAIGAMLGELHRINHELSLHAPSKPLGCGGKRRARVSN